MIVKMNALIQKLRWALDPNRWMIRWLKLSKSEASHNAKALILIQIDGLSHSHFHKALESGRLPFLKSLLKKEHYHDWHHYSGIPSSTPSIQGELFYGVQQFAPAFKFRDHVTGKIFTFYDSHAASESEARLKSRGEPLLSRGSSYSNIFRGGAGENAHFCAASVGWTPFFKALHPLALTLLVLFNWISFVRLFYYWIVELFLAVYDAVLGAIRGFGFGQEIMFILSRLIAAIGLRELAVLGTKLDIARGLPIIHVNFFGYDDQAHRRGPGSPFAYWALPGIDAAIKRIWKAAQNSVARDYEIWIYSDHGQEEVVPYPIENKIKIEEAVEKIFHQMLPDETFELAENGRGPQSLPSRMFVAAQGPIGFIYPHRLLSDHQKNRLAQALVEQAHIPLVITLLDKKAAAYTREGKFDLLDESSRILGESHPYLDVAAKELESLCRHPDAGEFVISGWRKGPRSVSFPYEYGSHAGPGPHETDGFALLPKEFHAFINKRKYLRPVDLRNSALRYLRGDNEIFCKNDHFQRAGEIFRVMTYNVHGCVGMDGKLSPERIARVIARHDPDVIALQELDAGRLRSRGVDQAKMIAELLEMEHHFHPVRMIEEEMFGNAVLSRYPMKVVRAGALPRFWSHAYFEPRGVLWVEIDCHGEILQFLNTHFSFWAHEQKKQARALCGPEWLGDSGCSENVILCGDFNAVPQSAVYRILREKLDDAQARMEPRKPLKTWFSQFPLGRIDHIFASWNIGVLRSDVPSSRLERLASDHLPVVVDFKIPAAQILPNF